jgi:hypothetical protein
MRPNSKKIVASQAAIHPGPKGAWLSAAERKSLSLGQGLNITKL